MNVTLLGCGSNENLESQNSFFVLISRKKWTSYEAPS